VATFKGPNRTSATKSAPPRCLVAIADDLLANFVDVLLNHGEYARKRARTLDDAGEQLRQWEPHLAIVELALEGGRGAELINRATPHGPLPVIILAPRGGMRTRLEAFERGADDVLSIPFPPEELIARALALVKRRHGITVKFRPSIRIGHLELDILAQKVRVDHHEIDLTSREDALLYVLAAAAGHPVGREQLLTYMYGDDALVLSSNVIDRLVVELRRKLAIADPATGFIETSPGGYLLRIVEPSERRQANV
jgi:DNA-binding response OmpR family regulator